MTRNTGFFASKQGAAQMKYAILKSYLPAFAGSTGSTSADNRVAYIDAFAGPGAYDDGTPGSPSVVLGIAESMKSLRTIEGYCIESKSRYFKELSARLETVDKWHAIRGTATSQIDQVLDKVGDLPCFAFLDPFGIKDLPYDLVIRILARGPKTECLVRFDNSGVWRTGGHLTSDHGSESSISALTDFCGGNWWQGLWQPGHGRNFSDTVLAEYAQRVAKRVRCGYLYFEVADSLDTAPDYHLIHFASHPLAFWKMNEALSIWAENARSEESLFDQPSVWVGEIESNIESLLQTGAFTVRDRLGSVMGDALGKARGKHVREALRNLETKDIIAGPVKGAVDRFRVQRAT